MSVPEGNIQLEQQVRRSLTKVPTNIECTVVIGACFLEETINLTSIGSVDIGLFKEGQFGWHVGVVLFHKLDNFLVSARLLRSKLVTRKRKDL